MTDNKAISCNSEALIDLTVALTDGLADKIDALGGDVGTVVTASLISTARVSAVLALAREKELNIPVAETQAMLINIFKLGFEKHTHTDTGADTGKEKNSTGKRHKFWSQEDDLKMMYISLHGWDGSGHTLDTMATLLNRSENAVNVRIMFYDRLAAGGDWSIHGTDQIRSLYAQYAAASENELKQVAFHGQSS